MKDKRKGRGRVDKGWGESKGFEVNHFAQVFLRFLDDCFSNCLWLVSGLNSPIFGFYLMLGQLDVNVFFSPPSFLWSSNEVVLFIGDAFLLLECLPFKVSSLVLRLFFYCSKVICFTVVFSLNISFSTLSHSTLYFFFSTLWRKKCKFKELCFKCRHKTEIVTSFTTRH